MSQTINYYNEDNPIDNAFNKARGIDLVVILGNAVNGTDWDG